MPASAWWAGAESAPPPAGGSVSVDALRAQVRDALSGLRPPHHLHPVLLVLERERVEREALAGAAAAGDPDRVEVVLQDPVLGAPARGRRQVAAQVVAAVLADHPHRLAVGLASAVDELFQRDAGHGRSGLGRCRGRRVLPEAEQERPLRGGVHARCCRAGTPRRARSPVPSSAAPARARGRRRSRRDRAAASAVGLELEPAPLRPAGQASTQPHGLALEVRGRVQQLAHGRIARCAIEGLLERVVRGGGARGCRGGGSQQRDREDGSSMRGIARLRETGWYHPAIADGCDEALRRPAAAR